MAIPTEDELLAYARECIRGEKPLFELAHMIGAFRQTTFTEIMFGKLRNEMGARLALKKAEYEALKGRD